MNEWTQNQGLAFLRFSSFISSIYQVAPFVSVGLHYGLDMQSCYATYPVLLALFVCTVSVIVSPWFANVCDPGGLDWFGGPYSK